MGDGLGPHRVDASQKEDEEPGSVVLVADGEDSRRARPAPLPAAFDRGGTGFPKSTWARGSVQGSGEFGRILDKRGPPLTSGMLRRSESGLTRPPGKSRGWGVLPGLCSSRSAELDGKGPPDWVRGPDDRDATRPVL